MTTRWIDLATAAEILGVGTWPVSECDRLTIHQIRTAVSKPQRLGMDGPQDGQTTVENRDSVGAQP